MSKTEATRIARKSLQNGYYAHPEGARVKCPRCERHDVILYSTAGRLSHGDMLRQLAVAVDDCEYDAQHGNVR